MEGAIFGRAKAGPPGGSAVALRELAKALGKTRQGWSGLTGIGGTGSGEMKPEDAQ